MKRANLFKRLSCLFVVFAILASFAVPAYAADDAKVTFEQVDNSAVSATIPGREPAELKGDEDAYDAEDVVRVSIVLEKAGTIEAGYSTMNIAKNNAAMNYNSRLEKDQANLIAKIEKATKEDLDVVWNLTLAANIISANVKFGQIEKIEKMAGVKSVVIETQYLPDVVSSGAADPNMATSGKQIGSAAAWAAGYTGAGSRIAIIDTGTDTDHQSFSASGYEYSLAYQAGLAGMTVEEYKESLDLLNAAEIDSVLSQLNAFERTPSLKGEDLYINSKLAYGYNYIDRNLTVHHDNDSQGSHGSHVAGIATANAYIPSGDGYVNALDTAMVQGVAPNAQLITMKVFGKAGGAYDSDYMAAIEDAIVLGADAVNLSLGSGNPGMSRNSTAEYQAILDSLVGSGVVVAMSAGNAGYWAENAANPYLYADDVSMQTDGSPGSFTNSFAVASVDNDGTTGCFVSVDGQMIVYNEMLEGNTGKYSNLPFTTIAGDHEYVFIDGIGSAADWAAVGEALEGKIALCSRGEISFFEKAQYAVEAGAIATFIYNNQAGVINMDLSDYPYTAPCASLTQAQGAAIKAVSTPVTDEAGNVLYYTGTMTVSSSMGSAQFNSDYYTMSSFSSWGVPGSLELKPEITAPGGSIYSINGVAKDGKSYEVMSGTSMASPQVAGMAAVVAQYVRENGLAEKTGVDARALIQSLLMSTAEPMLIEADTYYPVIQQGAGLANVGAATTADTYILMNANATASYADGKVKAELGDDPDRDGVYTFSFTINNLENVEKIYTLGGDFFIQAPTADNAGNLYMYLSTALIGASTTFEVDGKTVEAGSDMSGMDFNGDGAVNALDGQALLDYATGALESLYNTDKADLNGDEEINSYDAYLFFQMMEDAVVVPADGSVEVTVTVTLDAAWKSTIDYYYPNGTYIQGYVYAEGVSSEEGVAGTSHSIPVLAFYGNWSDASMFEKGSVMEYTYGLEDRAPYLYEVNDVFANGLTVTYAGDPNEYWFGGNPMVQDETYMPERNAISSVNGSTIASVAFTNIRNAADSYFVVIDQETGDFFEAGTAGEVPSAYYYVNGAVWKNTNYTLDADFNAAGIPDGTAIEVGMMLIPEYYVDYAEGAIDVAALGEGAYFTMPMVVDNAAPVLESVNINIMNNSLDVTVADNQYVSAIALFDEYGEYLYTYEGSKSDVDAGATVNYVIDLAEVNGPRFLLQVYDYAMNTTTYEINFQIGEVVDYVESIELSASKLMMAAGSIQELTAVVYPVNASNRNVIWTSSNDAVATVDENGAVKAVSAGTAVITAAAEADETLYKTCTVTVVEVNSTLYGVLQGAEGTPMQFSWNLKTDSTWTAGNPIAPYIENVAWDSYRDTMFLQETETMLAYQLDPATGETIAVSDGPAAFGAPCYDITVSPLFGDEETSYLFGVFNGYFLGPVMNLDNTFNNGWDLASYLRDYTGASRFVAVCDYGYTMKNGKPADVYLALDNSGTLWQLTYDGSTSIGLGFIPTDLDLPYTKYADSQYCSLVSDMNGDLYLSHFNGSTNEIYYLTFNAASRGFVSLYVGNVGADVWPAALYMAEINEVDDAQAAKRDFEPMSVEYATMVAENLEIQQIAPIVEESAAGSLNAVANYNGSVAPLSVSEVASGEGTVTVTVTAKDATGADVDSTNAVSTVTYDEDALVLKSIVVEGDYVSVNPADLDDADGSVTFGYVALDGIAAGETVATLIFEVKDTAVETVTVTHEEVNDETPDYDEVVAIDYPHLNTEVRDAVAATCTEDGYTGDTYCLDCGRMIAEGEVIPATGHSFGEWVLTTEPTCTETGVETRTCACGETETREVEALGHTYEAVVTAPTCTEAGYTTYTCSVCGDSYVADETEALGHSYESVVTAPTCTEPGYTTHTCSVCGFSFQDSFTAAKGHNCITVVTAPTCTEAGYTTHTCMDCDYVLVTDEVEALGHTFGEWTVTTEPTCTEDGEETRTCEVCGETETQAVAATGHNHEAVVTAPTCTEAGYTTYTCACGDTYVADEVAALGHTAEVVPGKDATCEETGLTEGEKCSVCDEVLTEQEEIPATGHKYVDVVTKPTKTEKGYTTHTCENCGHSYVDSYTDPTPDASADTGDAFNALWIFMLTLSMAGAAALVLNRKKFFK